MGPATLAEPDHEGVAIRLRAEDTPAQTTWADLTTQANLAGGRPRRAFSPQKWVENHGRQGHLLKQRLAQGRAGARIAEGVVLPNGRAGDREALVDGDRPLLDDSIFRVDDLPGRLALTGERLVELEAVDVDEGALPT